MIKFSGIFFILLLIVQPAFAMNNKNQIQDEFLPEWYTPSSYAYSPAGVADPFIPFVRLSVREEDREVLERPQRPLTPLERIEIGQLKLVGIIWDTDASHAPSAMVELPDGKGFILKKGTVVGPNQGQVIAILTDQVILVEEVTNIYGATVQKRTILELRPGQEG